MTLLLTILAIVSAIVVLLATCIQRLYLESLRIRSRELPALAFFREELEGRIGLTTERGALTFSLIKHLGMTVMGCLTYGVTSQGATLLEGITGACLLAGLAALLTTQIIPSAMYYKTSGRLLAPLAPLYRLLAVLARPIVWVIEFGESLFELGDVVQDPDEHIEKLISAGEEEGIIEEGDRELIQSVVAFGDKTVREVMTPRPRVTAISQDASLEQLRQQLINERYSRLPAYDADIDTITGFVHVRDLFELDDKQRASKRVRDVMRPIRAVPESKHVNDLLNEMREEGSHMAVVVDEYGSTAGIVTLEDLVEEIVGEIHDEHEPERDFREEAPGRYLVAGSFDVGRLEELTGIHLEADTESTTVGGLVAEWLERLPAVGDAVERDGVTLEVVTVAGRRVEQVRVSKLEEDSK